MGRREAHLGAFKVEQREVLITVTQHRPALRSRCDGQELEAAAEEGYKTEN